MSEFVSCDQKFLEEKQTVHDPEKYTILYSSITEDALLYFTGFTFKTFSFFLDAMLNFKPEVFHQLNTQLTFPDQIIMTLTKYKHNLDFQLLRAMYLVSPVALTAMFKQISDLLHEYFSQFDFWSARKYVNGSYSILLFVLPIRTYKYIIVLDSNSNVIYCSKLFPIAKPNRDIILEAKILDNVDVLKDIVMIDKSFNIQDLLKERNINTTLPTKLAGSENNKTVYRVKQNRITIEHVRDIDDKEMLEKIVYTSNMLISYTDLA